VEVRKAMKRVWLTTGFLIFWLPVSVPAFERGCPQDQRKYPSSIEVQIGSERMRVSAARGFVEPTQAFPRMREFAEQYVPKDSHLLAIFLLEKSLPAGDKGDVGDLSRYILVETERSYEEKYLSRSSFSRTKLELRMYVNSSTKKSFDEVRAFLKKGDSGVDVAGMENTGWVDEGDRYITFGRLARFSDASGSRVVVSVSATVLVKGKALSLLVYTPFTSYDDVEWAEGVSNELVTNVLKDN
jgi:hypothetical protein